MTTQPRYDVGPDHPKLTVTQISKLTRLHSKIIKDRLDRGISGSDLLAPSQRPQRKYDVGPDYPHLSVQEIAKLTGLGTSTVDSRIKRGITGSDLLAPRGHAGELANNASLFRYDVGPNHPKMSAAEIAKLTGLTEDAVRHCYRRGLRGSQLIEQQHSPKQKPIRKIAGVSTSAIVSRYNNGWRGADLLAPSQDRRKTTIEDITKYSVGQHQLKMTIKEMVWDAKQFVNASNAASLMKSYWLVYETAIYTMLGPNHPKLSIDQIVKISGISKYSVTARIKRGVTGADLLLHRLSIGYYDRLN